MDKAVLCSKSHPRQSPWERAFAGVSVWQWMQGNITRLVGKVMRTKGRFGL